MTHKLPEGLSRKCHRKIVKQEVAKEWGTCGCLSLNQYNKWARWGVRSPEETEERSGMWDSFGAYRGTREMERPKGAANFGFPIIQILVKMTWISRQTIEQVEQIIFNCVTSLIALVPNDMGSICCQMWSIVLRIIDSKIYIKIRNVFYGYGPSCVPASKINVNRTKRHINRQISNDTRSNYRLILTITKRYVILCVEILLTKFFTDGTRQWLINRK